MAKTRVDDADPIVGALPLMGAKYWIARAAEPYADRVGPDFTLAPPPPRPREGSEAPVTPARAAVPDTKPRRRSRAA